MTNLGDIALPVEIEVLVRLDAPGCLLNAAGPVGILGMSRVTASYAAGHVAYRLRVPEPGLWWIEATCGERPRAVLPTVIRVGPGRGSQVVDAILAPASPDSP